ncbi:MAG: GyrI-like domain-containing protein [Firmicutes bacterium]|nr:GyrI-like domain-containing protein [Bacillota bacterium]
MTKVESIPRGIFASSTVINDEGRINSAWNYLYFTWLQSSMFEYTNQPYYEEYIIKNNNPAKLKLYLPIRERSKETKIKLINNPGLRFIVANAKGYNAEEAASKTMTDYLAAHYPHILSTSKELYVQKGMYSYACGVRANTKQEFAASKNVGVIATTESDYLVLESNVMGDYDRYADILFSFAQDNGMDADKKQIFAIYDTKNGFLNPMVKMYCPVKFCTK